MSEDRYALSESARRWLRTMRIVRWRVRESNPTPDRYVLVVTPMAETEGGAVHVETGSDRWTLLDRGGDVAMRWGVACVISVHDLEEPDIESGMVAWLPVDADGHVETPPPRSDAHETVAGTSDAEEPTASSEDTGGSRRPRPSWDELQEIARRLYGTMADLWTVSKMPERETQPGVRKRLRRELNLVQDPISRTWFCLMGPK